MIFCQKNNVACFSREYVGYNKHEEGKNVGSKIHETRLVWTAVNYPTAKYKSDRSHEKWKRNIVLCN